MKNLKVNKKFFNEKKDLVLNKTKKVLAGALIVASLALPVNANAQTNFYEFGKGDTLWRIASEYYGDGNYWSYLAAYNNIEDPKLVRDGTMIVIPELNTLLNWCYGEDPEFYNQHQEDTNYNHCYQNFITYTFQQGDTLWGLCKSYYGDGNYWEMLKEFNGIENERCIVNGTVVTIPRLDILLNWWFGCDYEVIPLNIDYMYTCGPNDTLWNICKDYYGYGTYYEYLIEYNYDHYGIVLEPRKIHDGDILYLPPIEALKEYKNVKQK